LTTPEQRLVALGVELPDAPVPVASYVPYQWTGPTLWTSGQIAVANGALVAEGLCGRDADLETAQRCARQCAVNVIAQLKAAVGNLSRIRRVVKLTVYVASDPSFRQQHLVANGASDLVAEVFGDAGAHARSAVGVAVLPMGSPVEVDAVVEVDPA
jgi:enamine deaminase RidA (YjgF/YER057c/UK114 family)